MAIGAAMLNESWVSVQMLSNTPYWSIAYEVFYYALFAALFYLKGALALADPRAGADRGAEDHAVVPDLADGLGGL